MADQLNAEATLRYFQGGADTTTSDPSLALAWSSISNADDLDFTHTRFDLPADGEMALPNRDYNGIVYFAVRNLGSWPAQIIVPTYSLLDPDGDSLSTAIVCQPRMWIFTSLNVKLANFPPMYAGAAGGPTTIEVAIFGQKV